MNYELMLIFSPDLGEADLTSELKEVTELISSDGGEVTHREIWGLRDLAYRIKKEEQGIYVVLNFEYPNTEKLNELNNNLVIANNILRFLITRTPSDYSIITLEELEAEEQNLEAEKEKGGKKEEEKPVKKASPAPKKAEKKEEEPESKKQETPEEKTEKEPAKKEENEPAKKEEKEPAKKEEKESKNRLSDVDDKLKNLINDPDISL